MKTIHTIYIYLVLSLLTHSCSKWIDVKPTDRLDEDQLFINREGYLKALNGVYVEMAHTALYGQAMTTGAIDVLGQYYFMSSSTHNYYRYATFAYTEGDVKTTFDNAWQKAYELIANCNVILEKCGNEPSDILPQPYYGIIKGETLALRAMLHLDMLRLFGPIYTDENKATLAIPYVNKTGYDIAPLLGSEEIMRHVVADLEAATILMEDTDPIRTEGVRNGNNPSGSNDLYYRQYRLNYYATKALLARAYLWQNNKADALTQATAVLDEVFAADQTVFPFVTFAQATDPTTPDRLFSSEVMFALYDINRKLVYDRLFSVNLTPENKLSFSAGDENRLRVDEMYDDGNDYRRRIWQTASNATESATTNMKYADIVDGPGRYMIPLIRVSELLLIVAECHPDLTIATEHLNVLRTARNTIDLAPATAAALKLEIGREYRREMIGEGQQFFFYKRNAYQSIPNHAAITGVKTMVLNNYTVPLPDSETAQRD